MSLPGFTAFSEKTAWPRLATPNKLNWGNTYIHRIIPPHDKDSRDKAYVLPQAGWLGLRLGCFYSLFSWSRFSMSVTVQSGMTTDTFSLVMLESKVDVFTTCIPG